MKLVSIIIPVYNIKGYLEKCLDTVIRQTYKNIEIILVDDGSTDGSGEICDTYSNKYDNVYSFHKKNSGVSATRNYGLEKAKGYYVTFVDSDDFIEETMIEKMVFEIEKNKVDMVACGYFYDYVDNVVPVKLNCNHIISGKQIKFELFKNNSIRGFCWNKLFILDIIKKNKLGFDCNIKICEDLLFVFNYINCIENIYVLDEPFYHYRMRKSSASNNNIEKDITVFDAISKMNELDSDVYSYMKNFYAYLYFKYYKVIRKKDIFKKIKKISLKELLYDKNINKKTKLYSFAYLLIPSFLKKDIKLLKHKKFNYYK